MAKSTGRETISFALGKKTGTYELDFSLYTGKANRSDQILTDYHPENPYHSFNMPGQSTLNPLFFSAVLNIQI